jgi:PKD repeat protein
MVEFALVLPVFLFLLLIAVDFGRVFFTTIQLGNAVREAAAYGAIDPTDTTGMLARANAERNNQAQAGQQGSLASTDLTTVCRTPGGATISCATSPGGAGAGNTMTVALNETFTFFTPFINGFFGNSFHVSSSTTVAVLKDLPSGGGGGTGGCSAPTLATFTVASTGLTVTLDPAASQPDSGPCAISGYNFAFGDGTSGVGGTVPTTHTYAVANTYQVTLQVTNQGGTLSSSQYVTVPAPVPTPTPSPTPGPTPTPSPTPSPTPGPTPTPTPSPSPTPSPTPCPSPTASFDFVITGANGKTVQFTDRSTSYPACPVTVWLWDFGDGALSNAINPSHTYSKKDTYTVTLTVTSSSGPSTRSRLVAL